MALPRLGLVVLLALVAGCGPRKKAVPAPFVDTALPALKPDLEARSVNAFITGVSLGHVMVQLDLVANADMDSDSEAISTLYNDAIEALGRTISYLEASLAIFDSLVTESPYTHRMYENRVRDLLGRIEQLKGLLVSGELVMENIPAARERLAQEVIQGLASSYSAIDRSAIFCFDLGLECGEALIYLKWRQFHLRVRDDAYWNQKGAYWLRTDQSLSDSTYEEIARATGPRIRIVKSLFLERRFSNAEITAFGEQIVEIIAYFYARAS